MPLTELLIAPLAFIAGFACHRGTVCSVIAAEQIVKSGRTTRLKAFLLAAVMAGAVTVPLSWFFPDFAKLAPDYGLSLLPVLGGACYGLGAFVNGACAFGTFARMTQGETTFMLTPIGIGLGVMASITLGLPAMRGPPRPALLAAPTLQSSVILAVGAAIALMALVALVRTFYRAGTRPSRILTGRHWRPAFAMVVMGLSAGLLFAIAEPWPWTSLVRQTATFFAGISVVFPVASILGPIFLLLGGVSSSTMSGRFRWRWPQPLPGLRALAGGALMGSAASLIPGGNDVMVLFALPALSASAVAAYVTMMLTLLAALLVFRRLRGA